MTEEFTTQRTSGVQSDADLVAAKLAARPDV